MMLLRVLERVHGHLGWLAAAALLHPAIVLRNPRRRARLATTLATATAALTGALGAFLYADYSRTLRRPMYLASTHYGLLFERKEHLAFAAIALACAGCLLHWTARDDAPAARARARAAHLAFVAAATLTVAVAAMGTAIAAFKSF